MAKSNPARVDIISIVNRTHLGILILENNRFVLRKVFALKMLERICPKADINILQAIVTTNIKYL